MDGISLQSSHLESNYFAITQTGTDASKRTIETDQLANHKVSDHFPFLSE